MAIQQVSQLVSSFELLVEPISPVPIPAPPTTAALSGEVGSNGGTHGGVSGGAVAAVAPVALATTGLPIYTSAGPLSRIVRAIASAVPMQEEATLSATSTLVTPIAIQGYFVWISNFGSDVLTLTVTVSADPATNATLTRVTDPSKPLTASVLAITSVGNGNILNYLRLVDGVPTLTLPAAIPAGGTALFTLVGNYALFPDLTKATLEARGSLSIAIDPSSSAQFAQVLLEPQTRTTFVTPGVPAPAETAFALPTARGNARYTLPGPTFYIRSALNGYVIDAAGPVLPSGLNQAVINPINGNPTQLWYFTSDGYIVNAATNYVLDLQGASTNNGTPILVYPRKNPAASNQQWNLLPNNTIQSRVGNVVINVTGSNTAPGTPLTIFTSNGGGNQQWFLLPTLS